MEKLLKVTGNGIVDLKPEITIITIEFNEKLTCYESVLESTSNNITYVQKILSTVGIDKEALKTTHYNVEPYYESYMYADGKKENVFKGYEYNQTLSFKFGVSNDLLKRVLNEFAKITSRFKFRVNFGLNDFEKAKNELLSKAINDAKNKAVIISNAAGVALGEIVEIKYGSNESEFLTRPYSINLHNMFTVNQSPISNCDIDITPENIMKSDNVILVYSIK